jgi:glycerophosphoryl diester phosphodiesterase
MNYFEQFNKKHIIIAHRGFRSILPENTIFAFEAAWKISDMFEFDVQFTKDKIPIIMHDEILLRTTNVKEIFPFRKNYKVENFTLEEIKKLDNVSWFIKTNPFKTVKKHINFLKNLPKNSIPTLEEVVKFIKRHNFPANLEIKHSFFSVEESVEIIVNLIKKYKTEHLILISSFNHEYLKYISKKYPCLFTAALFDKPKNNLLNYLQNLKVCAYHPSMEIVNFKIVSMLRKNNIFTNVYTVDNKFLKRKLFSHHIKGIFTDYADL